MDHMSVIQESCIEKNISIHHLWLQGFVCVCVLM